MDEEEESAEEEEETEAFNPTINSRRRQSTEQEVFGLKRGGKQTTFLEEMRVVNLRGQPDTFFDFQHIFTIDLSSCFIRHPEYNNESMKCFTVRKLLKFYRRYKFDAEIKLNDNGDIIITIGLKEKEKITEVKEMLLILKENQKEAFILRPNVPKGFFENIEKQ